MLAIEVEHLAKRYKSGVQALHDFSIKIPVGSFYAILGPNGAGKSTFIGIVTSLVRKSAGRVLVMGHDLDQEPEKVKRLVGVVPQEFNCNMFERCIDVLVYQAGYYGIKRSDALVLAEKNLRLLELWDKRFAVVRSLSGGMKRRLMIARALMHDPKILILDEPSAGVDVEIRRSMWDLLRNMNQSGVSIILTTHYLEEVEQLCNRVAIIDKGRILEDTTIPHLIMRLTKETYVLTTDGNIPPQLHLDGVQFKQTDAELEVTVARGIELNHVFSYLNGLNVRIMSLRNKVNRLEELFYNIVMHKEEKIHDTK